MGTRNERFYRNRFFELYGEGPYPCFFCEEPVSAKNVLVHHKDHDHYNDIDNNLVPAHVSCHISHHKRFVSDETRQKLSNLQKGRTRSEETKKKISEARLKLGKTGPQSEETKKKKSEAVKAHWENDPERRNKIKRGEDGKFVRD